MPGTNLSAREQAELLDDLFEASNAILDYKRKMIMFTFNEECTSQKDYIVMAAQTESAKSFYSQVGSDGLWAVAFVNGEPDMELNYISACKMTGAIPDVYDKVIIVPDGSYVYPGKEGQRLYEWLQNKGFFIVYAYDYQIESARVDVLKNIGPYFMYGQAGTYKNIICLDSIDEAKADMDKIERFWKMLPEECKPRLYQQIASRIMHKVTSFWRGIFPDQGFEKIMQTVSFGQYESADVIVQGTVVGSDEIVLVPPPLPGSPEEQVVTAAKKAKVWQYAWQKVLNANGLRVARNKPVQDVNGFCEIGRFLGVDEVAGRIFSQGDLEPSHFEMTVGFSASFPNFAALYETVEGYMEEQPGRVSLSSIKSLVERCGYEVVDTRLYALFSEGFALETAAEHVVAGKYGDTIYDHYDNIDGFDDVHLAEEPVCFALFDANVAWCGLETRPYQYAAALAVLDSDLDCDAGWMVAFSITGDGDRAALEKALGNLGQIAYDEVSSGIDVIASKYSLGISGPSLSEDAALRRPTALQDRQSSEVLRTCIEKCLNRGHKLTGENLVYILSLFAIMADAFAFEDELGERLRKQTLLAVPDNKVNAMLDSMLASIEMDDPQWIEEVEELSEISGIWIDRLGQYGLEPPLEICPEDVIAGKDGLRKLGRFLGIDSDLETFKHGVPREDITA